MKFRKFFIFCFFVLVVGVCVAALLFLRRGEMPCYEVVELTMDGGVIYSVSAINDVGQVAGRFDRNGKEGACIWDEVNGLIELTDEKNISYVISDMNNKGQAVGFYFDKVIGGNTTSVAFFRDTDGAITPLPYEEDTITTASGINDKGEVVGIIRWGKPGQKSGVTRRVFIWDKIGGMRVIDGIEGSFLRVGGINEAGQVAGLVGYHDGYPGFIWSGKSGIVYIEVKASQIFDIDESGNVLGSVHDNEWRLFVWNESEGVRMLDVGGDMLEHCRMNDKGDVVGTVTDWGVVLFGKFQLVNDDAKSFMCTRDGKTISFDQLFEKDEYFYPVDINNYGWIVGYVLDNSKGEFRGVLLRPE